MDIRTDFVERDAVPGVSGHDVVTDVDLRELLLSEVYSGTSAGNRGRSSATERREQIPRNLESV